MKYLACVVLLAAAGMAGAQVSVSVPSADVSQGAGHLLKAFWFPAAAEGRTPAVVLLHGCGGAYDRQGRLASRMRDYADIFNAAGLHVLVLDSFSSRGVKEVCTQRASARAVTQSHRRIDALSALEWLAARPDVDADRLGLVGWSNGASTVLAATNGRHGHVKSAPVKPSFAIAFYPGCEQELRAGYQPVTRLLMLLGEADDWTSAKTCTQLARRSADAIEWELYPGAHHGFDSTAPVRHRTDVPRGVHPGRGVHVGGDPEALRRSRERLRVFLEQALAARPAPPPGRP